MPPVAKGKAEGAPKPKGKRRKRVRRKPRKLKLKGWLKTSEDWARFNEWVKVKALPRKLPEPEPLIRPSRPLSRLKKRAKLLARPKDQPAVECAASAVSGKALRGRASARTKRLAIPSIRDGPSCRPGGRVKRAALRYEATDAILLLSLPKIRDGECGGERGISRGALGRKSTDRDARLARPKWSRDAEGEGRGRRTRMEAEELSAWMEFLAIPNYRVLKELDTATARKWKKQIVNEIVERGKQALEEQLRQREEEEKRLKGRNKKKREVQSQKSQSNVSGEKSTGEEKENGGDEEEREDKQDTVSKKSKDTQKGKGQKIVFEEPTERRKKDAWRYINITCVSQPLQISKAALKYEASPKIQELAVAKIRKDNCITMPLAKKSAKKAQASPRVVELSKPKYTSDPVKRKLPWERDEYDRTIIPKPPYGKVLPKPKPYEPRKCEGEDDQEKNDNKVGEEEEEEEEKEEENNEQGEEKKRKLSKNNQKKAINPLVFADTVDPLFDPKTAAKQADARKHAIKDGTLKSPKTENKKKEEQKEEKKEDQKEQEEQKEEQMEKSEEAAEE